MVSRTTTTRRRPAKTRPIIGVVVGLALALPSPGGYGLAQAETPAAPPADARAKQLNLEGQRHFDAQNYEAAAQSWFQILTILPESEVNRAERDNAVLIALEGCKEAYRARRGQTPDDLDGGVTILRRCIASYDRYVDDFGRVYSGAPISSATSVSGDEVRRMLADAERELNAKTPPQVPNVIVDTGTLPPTGNQRSGNGLIAGGVISIAFGLGATSMIIVGAKHAQEAKDEVRDAQDSDDEPAERDADAKGRRANGLIAGGAVLSGVLLAGGAVMLAFGIRRRLRYQAFVPVMGPQYVGLRFKGKF